MQTEWEAAFWAIDKDELRSQLRSLGAEQKYPERLMRRINLFPPGYPETRGFARIRDEGDRITMCMKRFDGTEISGRKEIEVTVDDFERAHMLLLALGCRDKNYQETRRELWLLDDTEVTIDEWPFIEPLCEIEGDSEEAVRMVSAKLGFSWDKAHFVSADKMYGERYGVDPKWVNEEIPRLTFEIENPFLSAGKSAS